VGSVFDLLILSSPFTEQRIDNLIKRLNAIPGTLDAARENLTDPVQPFARIALVQLRDVRPKLQEMIVSLNTAFPNDRSEELESAAETAALALETYSQWLQDKLPEMSRDFAIGREAYLYFLKNIALVPYSPETLLQMSRQEWERAVSFETLENVRNSSIPPPEIMKTVDEEIEQARRDETAIKVFLIRNNLFTIPEKMGHYTLRATPEYLNALGSFGELDDFTAPDRLAENAVRYIPEPSPQLGFFYRTVAVDPRPLTVHEGVPGHYFQLLQAWQNPDFIRRHYFDSNANEGIGFYLEEMLLQEGLFDDRPHERLFTASCSCGPCGWQWTSIWHWENFQLPQPENI